MPDQNQNQEQPKKQLFSTESPDANQVDLGGLGFDSPIQQVENSEQPQNPKDFFKNENDTVIKNIVDNKLQPNKNESFSESNAELLDEFSEIDKKLNLKIQSLEAIQSQKVTSRLIFIIVALVTAIVVFASLYFQDKINFSDTEVQTPLEESQAQLMQLQSELMLSQSKKASILLNQLAFQASDFQKLYNQSISEFESASAKQSAQSQLLDKQSQIIETLTDLNQTLSKAQNTYSSNPAFEEFYTNFLTSKLSNLEESSSSSSLTIFDTSQLTRNSSKLIRNKDLLAIINQSQLNQQTVTDTLATLRNVFSSTNLNYVTDLANFTLNRVELTRVFSELTKIATSFDPNFSPFNISPASNINFNNYSITANNTVSVTADIRTTDQNLFSIIANLDDAISNSPLFQDVGRATYSKNLSNDGEFTSSVNLDINLEDL
jgi:hypothetical protein